MAVPTLNPLWRPNDDSSRDDRELIRGYALWPVSSYNLQILTTILNRAADTSPATVAQCQAWIDEIENLEQDWSDRVSDGIAHLGNAQEYEGPMPGAPLTRQDRLKKADVLEWDTELLKVRTVSGGRADATASGVLATRIAQMKHRIMQALGVKPYDGSDGSSARLIRS